MTAKRVAAGMLVPLLLLLHVRDGSHLSSFLQTSGNAKPASGSGSNSTSHKGTVAKERHENAITLYCIVPFIWSPKYLSSYHAIKATWGRRCDFTKFFIDPVIGDGDIGYYNLSRDSDVRAAEERNNSNLTVPDDVIVLHDMHRPWHTCEGKSNCRNIWEKLWRSILWINTHGEGSIADYYVKVDSDSYLFPENMRHYVQERNWSSSDVHYFGHKLYHTDRRPKLMSAPIVSGVAVFLSGEALRKLGILFSRFKPNNTTEVVYGCGDAYIGGEELITAICFKYELSAEAEHALDSNGNELISIGPIDETLLWRPADKFRMKMVWYWKRKPERNEKGEETHLCCGDLPIAFHGYKDPRWLYKIDHEIYSEVSGEGDTGDWRQLQYKNTNNTLTYLGRVRTAMKELELIT